MEEVTPENVVQMLEKDEAPKEFDFLNVGIDGASCPTVEAVLKAGYRPKSVKIDVHPELPPPTRFAVQAKSGFRKLEGNPFWGCSLGEASRILRANGYELFGAEASLKGATPKITETETCAEGNGMIWIHKSLMEALSKVEHQTLLKQSFRMFEKFLKGKLAFFTDTQAHYVLSQCQTLLSKSTAAVAALGARSLYQTEAGHQLGKGALATLRKDLEEACKATQGASMTSCDTPYLLEAE